MYNEYMHIKSYSGDTGFIIPISVTNVRLRK